MSTLWASVSSLAHDEDEKDKVSAKDIHVVDCYMIF